LGISDGSVSRLIADALDLRHRLPLIWAAIVAGQAPAYQGRHIATATRHLTCKQARLVDARIAPSLGVVSYGRLQTLLEAAIMEVDPEGAERRAAEAAQERFVRLGRSSEYGLKLIIARATAGDAIWFKATIDRIADILAAEAITTPSGYAGLKRSAFWLNLPKRRGCCVSTKTTTAGTAPPNPMMIWPESQPTMRPTVTKLHRRTMGTAPNLITHLRSKRIGHRPRIRPHLRRRRIDR
jgi:Domain of unknown function (DUF222)